jgi:hypothetical protein
MGGGEKAVVIIAVRIFIVTALLLAALALLDFDDWRKGR